MCGILGLYDLSGFKSQKFKQSLKLLNHRGPDNQSVKKLSNQLALGHTRLSIIDLEAQSNQPFSIDNDYFLVFNGEIFNYKELRIILEKKGHTFKTKSDTEVLLISYIHWGEECVKKFNGMWAFVIYDRKENKLFCSRDRFGIKPFYYFFDQGKFMFSSMIQPILQYYDKLKKPNFKSINEFLYRGYISQFEETWFEKIKKILPGHNLIYDFDKVKIKPHYLPSFKKNDISLEAAKKELKKLLTDAVKLRLRSDVEVASTLTTGLDSSSIVSIIDKKVKKRIKTYTVYSENKSYSSNDLKDFSNEVNIDESHTLSLFSDFKIEPTTIKLNFDNYLDDLKKCICFIESGHASPAIVGISHVYKKAQLNGHKVLLEGQGSDEIFGGYLTEIISEVISKNLLNVNYLYRFLARMISVYSWKQMLLRMLNALKKHRFFSEIKNFIFKY